MIALVGVGVINLQSQGEAVWKNRRDKREEQENRGLRQYIQKATDGGFCVNGEQIVACGENRELWGKGALFVGGRVTESADGYTGPKDR